MKDFIFLNKARSTGMRTAGVLGVSAVALLFAAQIGCTRQRIYENLYEGIRLSNELQTLPQDRKDQQMSPNYGQYQNELRNGKP